MPALSYSKKNIEKYDFENKILEGIKIHTIRRYGPGLTKRPFKVGDILYHYKNWRTPQVKKIFENKCLWVADIEMQGIRVCLDKPHRIVRTGGYFDIFINERKIKDSLKNILAVNDGFDSFADFQDFFIKAGLPFKGQIIGWKEGISYE